RLWDEVRPMVRTGTYFQFLAKYPEANHLHKRMLDVSARVARNYPARSLRTAEGLPEAVRQLYRAQANCAYWHGLFGGIYLPHLRQRLWRHLIRAERALEDAGVKRQPLRIFDLNADRHDEVMVTTDAFIAVIDPQEGALVEWSD